MATLYELYSKCIFSFGHDLWVENAQIAILNFWEQAFPKLKLHPKAGVARIRHFESFRIVRIAEKPTFGSSWHGSL